MKVLRERLGEYVARARAGERIMITDRGQAVAELVPLSPERESVLRLVGEGQADWSGGKPRGLRPGIPNRGAPASQAVVDERDDSVL